MLEKQSNLPIDFVDVLLDHLAPSRAASNVRPSCVANEIAQLAEGKPEPLPVLDEADTPNGCRVITTDAAPRARCHGQQLHALVVAQRLHRYPGELSDLADAK